MQKLALKNFKKLFLIVFLSSYQAEAVATCFRVLNNFSARIVESLRLANRNKQVGSAMIGVFGRLKEQGLRTERLTLRPLARKDVDEAYDAILAGKESLFLNGSKGAEDAAVDIIEGLVQKGRSDEEGFFETSFAVYDNETKKFLGYVGITYRVQEQSFGLPYLIAPDAQNKGYATEALGALLDQFKQFSDKSIPIIVKPMTHNSASRRVFEKLGFSHLYDTEARGRTLTQPARPALSIYEFPE